MTKDEALTLALEALERGETKLRWEAITAIKEALAQPERDPWREAVAQRTWVGLTLDERLELAQDVDWAAGAYCEYAEKVEAKLKEKNT